MLNKDGKSVGAPRNGQGGKAPSMVAWAKRNVSNGVDLSAVDARLLCAALSVCVGQDVGLTFGAAQGGRGMVLTPYQHPVRYEKQYAGTTAEFEELLWALIDVFASPAEDIAALWSLERG